MSMTNRLKMMKQVVETGRSAMTPDLAKYILTFEFPKSSQRRYQRLATKAQAGKLKDEEHADLEAFVMMDSWIAILQAEAKRMLKKRGTSKRVTAA